MLVIPSIDVRGGRVVRLVRGDYSAETVFSDDAVAVVLAFADAGARRVHIVDLDAARGRPDATSEHAAADCVSALAGRDVDAQVGGGVRDAACAQRWFERGARLVVIGSVAVRDPTQAHALCATFPGRVLIALDVLDGEARAQGWTEPGGDALAHLDRWAAWPVAGIVHTSVARDGTLAGPDIEGLREVCRRFDGAVLASGGITAIDDVAACGAAGAAGVIVGRALHLGVFDLRAAFDRFADGAAA